MLLIPMAGLMGGSGTFMKGMKRILIGGKTEKKQLLSQGKGNSHTHYMLGKCHFKMQYLHRYPDLLSLDLQILPEEVC